MNERRPESEKREPPKKREYPFCRIGIEIFDVFVPLMTPDCFLVYSYLNRIEFRNPNLTHSLEIVAASVNRSPSTVSRALEILEYLGLVKLRRFRGSKQSECQLLDSVDAAIHLGAEYSRGTLSFSLPASIAHRLQIEVEALRARQQGKLPSGTKSVASECGENRHPRRHIFLSQRKAGISPEKNQGSIRERRTGTHLIQKKERIEDCLTYSPSPNDSSEVQEEKDPPDEDEPDGLLKWAVAQFTGPMNDLGDYLFDTNRPLNPRLANGAEEWRTFGLGSLAVEAAAWRGEVLALTLSANDPAAARRGLEKYRKKWETSLRKWYKCEVCWEIQKTERTWWNSEQH